MKLKILIYLTFLSIVATGQTGIDPSKLPLVHYKPNVEGISSKNEIGIQVVFRQGIKVILADKTFKVIQFDVVYDCHSRSIFDFDIRRYIGDRVDGRDDFLRKRILAGDVMDIANTVIEKDGIRYKMEEFSFIVTN